MPTPARRPANARRTSSKQRRGQHILDVNVRAHQASRQRKQRVFGAFSIALIFVGLGAGIFFGGRNLLHRFFLKNPNYNLTAVDVQTDGVLAPDAIAAAAQLVKGTNIFKIDLDGARARLSVIPEVEKVDVTRQLPNRVAIDVVERKPVAWIAPSRAEAAPRREIVESGKALLIDSTGIILPPRRPLPQNSHLPIIYGYTGSITLGRPADGEEIRSALDLLHAHQDSVVAARYQIAEIDLSKHFALVVTDQNGAHTMLGLDDMNSQLKKMEGILEAAEHLGRKVDTINLLVENNIPVTYQPEPTPEPAAALPLAAAAIVPTPGPAAAAAVKPAATKKEAPVKRAVAKPKAPKKAVAPVEVRRAQPLQPFN